MICHKCSYFYDNWGVHNNKCALLDYYNLSDVQECEYFDEVPEQPTLEDILNEPDTEPGVII